MRLMWPHGGKGMAVVHDKEWNVRGKGSEKVSKGKPMLKEVKWYLHILGLISTKSQKWT